MVEKEVKVLTMAEREGDLPSYETMGAAGADVRAKLESSLTIASGSSALIPTGLRFEVPEGYEIQVRPRSGLALKEQITVLNTPGTIDSDYRGEVGIILINHGKKAFTVHDGMRIAQLVLSPIVRARYVKVSELAFTLRGEGGFGHTGER